MQTGSKPRSYLDLDPKLGGASVGTLLAIVLQDLARRAGMEIGPEESVAYAGLVIVFMTWLFPSRRSDES